MSGDQTSGDQTGMEIKCPEIKREWRSNVRDQTRMEIKRDCAVGDRMRMEIECPRSNVRDQMSGDQMSRDQMRTTPRICTVPAPSITAHLK